MPQLVLYFLFAIVAVIPISAFSQVSKFSQAGEGRDTSEIRELLHRSAVLIDKKVVEKRKLDSAFILASRALQWSNASHFLKGTNDALFQQGMVYIKLLNDEELKKMLNQIDKELRAKIILEWIKYRMVFIGMRQKTEADTFLIYSHQALNYAESAHSAPLIALSFLQLSSIYYEMSEVSKGREFLLKAIAISQKEGLIDTEAQIFAQGSVHIIKDDVILPEVLKMDDRLRSVYSKRIKTGVQPKLQDWIIMGSTSVAFYYINRGNFSEALFHSLKMVKLLEQENNPFNEEMPYLTTSKIYLELGKMEECIDFCKRAADITKQKKAALQPLIIKNATTAYINLKRPQQGLEFIKQNTSSEDFETRSIIPESMGHCYFAMKQYRLAEDYYLRSLQIAQKGSIQAKLISYVALGKLYTETHQYDKARFYLEQLISQTNKSIVPLKIQRDVHLMIFKADSASRNYLSAIDHLHTYQWMNDSIFSNSQSRQIEELKSRYETDKKDQDIKLLTSEGELKESELQQTRLMRNGFIGGAILLISMLGLVYWRYRFKLRTNELLQSKQESINQSNRQLLTLNEELRKLLVEKEWLVKEMHHRVKNNLQIVVSLLNTHAAHLTEGEALDAIRDSQMRMQVISLLHQRLFNIDNSSIAEMRDYIPELVAYIKECYKGINHLYFELNIDSIRLDISQAVPVGLILNEAVTNAIKHAFIQSDKGIIRIAFEQVEDSQLSLSISDNGSGLPCESRAPNPLSFGLKLIETLTEQLNGVMSLKNDPGLTVKIIFSDSVEKSMSPSEIGSKL